MNTVQKAFATVLASAALAASAFAQNAAETSHSIPLVGITNEPAPTLTVQAPLPEALSRGVALIPYHVEHLRILPVLGPGATSVSPRVGHLHVTVDDLPWHWADFSENSSAIVVAGLPPGQHKLTIELAGADHHVYTGQTVTFTVPDTATWPH